MRKNLVSVGLAAGLLIGCGASGSNPSVGTGGNEAITTGGTGTTVTGGTGATSTTGAAATGGAGPVAAGGSAPTATGGSGAEATGGATAAATGGSGVEATGGATATGGSGAEATGGTGTDGTGGTSSTLDCTRDGLQAAVDAYFSAIQAHNPALLPGAASATYTENTSEVAVGESLWATAGTVTYTNTILDTLNCNSFSFAVSSWKEDGGDVAPIVMGVRLKVAEGNVTEVEAIITREGDWFFNAAKFQSNADTEGPWPILDAAQQGTRASVRAAGDAYFDNWMDTSIVVPAASGCRRLEGSMYAPCGALGDAVGVGFGQRHYVIDVEKGAVALIGLFGGAQAGSLDVHMFRVVSGEIVVIHTLTLQHDPEFSMSTGWPIYE